MNSLFQGVNAHFDFSAQTPKSIFSDYPRRAKTRLPHGRAGINIRQFFASAILSLLIMSPAYAHVASENHSTRETTALAGGANSTSRASLSAVSVVAAKTVGERITANSIGRLELAELESTSVSMPASVGAGGAMETHLQVSTLAVLDQNERTRLAAFAGLAHGWDFGKGEPLNTRSLQNFDRFFSPGNFAPDELSVFMSTDGNVVASWRDRHGGAAEIEFKPDQFCYFDDSMDEPRSISLLRAAELRRRIAEELVGS